MALRFVPGGLQSVGKQTPQQAAQSALTKRYSGGGGGGSAARRRAEEAASAKEAARIMAEKEAALKAAKELEEKIRREKATADAAKEKARIEDIARKLIRRGAQQQQQILKNEKGQQIRVTTTDLRRIDRGKDTSARVWRYENLDTGEVRYRDFSGFSRRAVGGVDFSQQTPTESKQIQKELFTSLLTPIVTNGQVVGFSSKVTKQSYPYTQAGFKAYENAINKISNQSSTGRITSIAQKGDTKISSVKGSINKFISNKLAVVGIRKDNRTISFISKLANELKNKGLNSVDKYRAFAEERRKKALKNMQKLNLKKPSTYGQALNWVLNFDKYITNRAIVTAVDLGIATPKIINQLRSAPLATIIALPPAIFDGFKQDFRTIKSGDVIGIINLTVDYFVYSAAFNLAGKGIKKTSNALLKVLPGTKKVVSGKILLRKATKLKPELALKLQTVKSGAKPLSAQARLAGKKVTAVTAQADQLFSLIKSKRIIRKPISGEAKFPAAIKRTLAKFDAGKRLTNKEFANVNMWLRRNVAPNITLLERSLYLDPASGLRASRLGIQEAKTATIRDILRGNFTLWKKTGKPQILVFENAQVAKFPKALRTIERKLKTGKTLTTAETNRLIRWQVQTGSGKFKPIGSTIYAGGKEFEITLAPGELIRRVKRIGRVYINGRKVTIVSAEVFKPSRAILRQMKLANIGKLTKNQVKKLDKFLSRKLGRNVRVETPSLIRGARRVRTNVPVLRVSGLGIRVLPFGRGLFRRTIAKRTSSFTRRISRPSSRISRRITRVSRRTTRVGRTTRVSRRNVRVRRINGRRITQRTVRVRRGTTRINQRVSRPRINRRLGRRGYPGERPKPKPPIALPRFKEQRLSKSIPTFYVVEKVRGKFKKLYPKPLSLKDARDYAAYSIDNRLSKTAFFIPLGRAKRVVRPPKKIAGYFSKTSRKFRPYRIRFGKKRRLVNGFIEKRKFFSDTIGEKSALRSLRGVSPTRRKQIIRRMQISRRNRRMIPNRRIRRRISPQRRRQLIMQLRKARIIRMRNLRRRK